VADQNATPRLLSVCPSVILGHWRRVHTGASETLEVVLIDCISVGVDRMQRNFEPMLTDDFGPLRDSLGILAFWGTFGYE
jgi:hypothetical protein